MLDCSIPCVKQDLSVTNKKTAIFSEEKMAVFLAINTSYFLEH